MQKLCDLSVPPLPSAATTWRSRASCDAEIRLWSQLLEEKKIKHSLMIDKCVLLATAKKRLTCTNNKKAMLVTMGLKTKHPVTALVGKLANNVPFL